MSRVIVLDSSPLELLFQKPHFIDADRCRDWLKAHFAAGAEVIVPEIIVYELKRELLRMVRLGEARPLQAFVHGRPGRFLPLTTGAMDTRPLNYGPSRGSVESRRQIRTRSTSR